MDPIRRKILGAGAAATAMAAAKGVFAQQTGPAGAGARFYEKGPVRIRYEDVGAGFPLMLLPGGGLNATISFFSTPAAERPRKMSAPAITSRSVR